MKYIIRFLVLAACLYFAPQFLTEMIIPVNDYVQLAIIAGALLLMYEVALPLLRIVAFPINFLTFGLFGAVLNIAAFYAVDYYFATISFGPYLTMVIFSFCVSFIYGFTKTIT